MTELGSSGRHSGGGKPVACTLRPAQVADRREAWRRLIDGWLLHREPTDQGVVLTFRADPGVADAARELAALEAECCAWMSIDVEDSDTITMSVRSPETAGAETIHSMFEVSA